MISDLAHGLFAKAITQSEPVAFPLKSFQSAETIVGAHKNLIDMASAPATIIDGIIVPDSPRKAIEAGREAQVPWMIGTVESEAAHFPE